MLLIPVFGRVVAELGVSPMQINCHYLLLLGDIDRIWTEAWAYGTSCHLDIKAIQVRIRHVDCI